MCRGSVDGEPGRRCPSCRDADSRSAYDRAHYATKQAEVLISDFPSFSAYLVEPDTFQPPIPPRLDDLKTLLAEQKTDFEFNSFDTPVMERASNNRRPDYEGMGLDSEEQERLADKLLLQSRNLSDLFRTQFLLEDGSSLESTTSSVSYSVYPHNRVILSGRIHIDGVQVGSWRRILHFKEGQEPYAQYELLSILPQHQNRRIGTKLLAHFDASVLALNIKRVKMTANIDVGGYAGAKNGYDWNDEGQTPLNGNRRIQELLENNDADYGNNPDSEVAIMVKRLDDITGENYPTPLEVAMVGRSNPDENGLWTGKKAMLKATWDATRTLA